MPEKGILIAAELSQGFGDRSSFVKAACLAVGCLAVRATCTFGRVTGLLRATAVTLSDGDGTDTAIIVSTDSTLRASLSGTFFQALPVLVKPLKGHSLSPRSCPLTLSAPSKRFAY